MPPHRAGRPAGVQVLLDRLAGLELQTLEMRAQVPGPSPLRPGLTGYPPAVAGTQALPSEAQALIRRRRLPRRRRNSAVSVCEKFGGAVKVVPSKVPHGNSQLLRSSQRLTGVTSDPIQVLSLLL